MIYNNFLKQLINSNKLSADQHFLRDVSKLTAVLVMKTQQQISSLINVLIVIYESNCRVAPKQKFQFWHDRILSIQRISD